MEKGRLENPLCLYSCTAPSTCSSFLAMGPKRCNWIAKLFHCRDSTPSQRYLQNPWYTLHAQMTMSTQMLGNVVICKPKKQLMSVTDTSIGSQCTYSSSYWITGIGSHWEVGDWWHYPSTLLYFLWYVLVALQCSTCTPCYKSFNMSTYSNTQAMNILHDLTSDFEFTSAPASTNILIGVKWPSMQTQFNAVRPS